MDKEDTMVYVPLLQSLDALLSCDAVLAEVSLNITQIVTGRRCVEVTL